MARSHGVFDPVWRVGYGEGGDVGEGGNQIILPFVPLSMLVRLLYGVGLLLALEVSFILVPNGSIGSMNAGIHVESTPYNITDPIRENCR